MGLLREWMFELGAATVVGPLAMVESAKMAYRYPEPRRHRLTLEERIEEWRKHDQWAAESAAERDQETEKSL